MSRHLRRHIWALVPALLLFTVQDALSQTPPVEDLQCLCEGGGADGAPRVVRLTWQNPSVDPQAFLIRIDGQPPIQIAGGQAGAVGTYVDNNPQPGPHEYRVVVVAQGANSIPVSCVVQCPFPPEAKIVGPSRVVLPPESFAAVILDGRQSTDGLGGTALRYFWTPVNDANVEILSPLAAVTLVRIPRTQQATSVSIQLAVERPPTGDARDEETITIDIVSPDLFPEEPPHIFPPPLDLLVAVVGQQFNLPVVFDAGVPYPIIEFLGPVPRGFGVEPTTGKINWIPDLRDAGLDFQIDFLAKNRVGEFPGRFQIRVVHPGTPVLMFAFPLAGGGGGTLEEAPLTISDDGSAQPAMDLQLSVSGDECAVQLISAPPGDPDPFDGVLFDPGCVPGSSGVYFTAAPSGGLLPPGSNDFSLELWVSGVQPPPAGRGYIFSNSQGSGADLNWLIAHDGGENFAGVVNVGGVEAELSVTASPRPDGLTQLVFVRRGDTHEFFVNGSFVDDVAVAPADLVGGWNANYPVTLGNSELGTQPFSGNVHLAVFYNNALSPNLIRYLDEIGFAVPTSVPPPVADICPDPGEIRRIVEADGSLSHSELGAAEGGGGGFVVGGGCPDMLIQPFLWDLIPTDIDAAPVAESVPDPSGCALETEISYVVPPSGLFDLTIRLTVTQVPVRGVVETAWAEKTIRLPTTYFRRLDANQDDAQDLSDAITILDMLFVSGDPLQCMDAGDVNDDGSIDISDAIYGLGHLFSGTAPPPAPFPDCGADPTDDAAGSPTNGDLGCEEPPDYCD